MRCYKEKREPRVSKGHSVPHCHKQKRVWVACEWVSDMRWLIWPVAGARRRWQWYRALVTARTVSSRHSDTAAAMKHPIATPTSKNPGPYDTPPSTPQTWPPLSRRSPSVDTTCKIIVTPLLIAVTSIQHQPSQIYLAIPNWNETRSSSLAQGYKYFSGFRGQ